jgi:hypothetical protein
VCVCVCVVRTFVWQRIYCPLMRRFYACHTDWVPVSVYTFLSFIYSHYDILLTSPSFLFPLWYVHFKVGVHVCMSIFVYQMYSWRVENDPSNSAQLLDMSVEFVPTTIHSTCPKTRTCVRTYTCCSMQTSWFCFVAGPRDWTCMAIHMCVSLCHMPSLSVVFVLSCVCTSPFSMIVSCVIT